MAHDVHLTALVLAGGRNVIALDDGPAPALKSLVPLSGRPSLAHVLAALRSAPEVRDVCIVGPEAMLREVASCAGWPDVRFAEGGESLVESLMSGLREVRTSGDVLIWTGDIPLLTSAHVSGFVQACREMRPDRSNALMLSVVPRSAFGGAYAATTKEFSRFRDVEVSHGNLALIDPSIAANARAMERINAIYASRKSPFRCALAVGFAIGLAYVLGVLMTHLITMARMAAIASRRFHVTIVPVSVPYPAIAVDIDEPADLRLVQDIMAGGAK